ncbi:MAG: hypothetical protein ACFCVE_01095 [Phycisphaerae bacterium]
MLHNARRQLPERFDAIDRRVVGFLHRYGDRAARWALAVVFIWFGLLKPLGVSPAAGLLMATVDWVPFIAPETMLHLIGWWEVAIGICLAAGGWSRVLVRVGLLLLALQMVGTFMPLFVIPGACFQEGRVPWAPTTEGQYIFKNLVIIAAAMVVGGNVRRDRPEAELR